MAEAPGSTVELPLPSREHIEAYVAVPTGTGPFPGVVVVHDAIGLTKIARRHVERLASYGYVTVAPDLYARGGFFRCVRATFRSLFSGEGQAYADLDAARQWLAGRPDCSGRIGVIGFCMGGGFALMTAAKGFDVSAPNYGQVPKDLSVLDGACPVVGSYGAKDRTLRGAAAKLEAALTERGVEHDVKEYPDAGHSFLDKFPLSPVLRVTTGFGYHEPTAIDAWERIRAFFDRHLTVTG